MNMDNFQKISKIVKRFIEDHPDGKNVDALSLNMDIEKCHTDNFKLDLDGLLNADNFNFFHDVVGIHNNLNRQTGKIENCFVPRFSK
jgi:hypothetical protein